MKTRIRVGLLKRLGCIFLAIAMIMSFAACGKDPTTGTTTAALSTTVPVPTTQASQPAASTPGPTEPSVPPTSVPVDPPETEPNYELVYTLTQENVDEFYRLLDECEKLSLAGEDMDAIDESVVALDECYEYLNEQRSIAMIFHYSHTSDEALEKQYLDTVDICANANDAYIQMARRVYLSESPAKESLFEGWTDEEIQSLLSYDEEITELQKRNAEIEVEYRAATDDDKKIALYIEMVGNNNKIAKYYDYDNYYTYAYERVYNRDYGVEELEDLRRYAKQHMTTAFHQALNNFYYSFYNDLPANGQVEVQKFLFNNYNAIGRDYVSMYIGAAPEGLSKAMSDMLDHDSLFTQAKDAMEGAFTTTIGERSYCYFGPGYWSCSTVIHESGHYYASLYSDLNSIPLDLAEVHSQANEWLFISYLDGKMSTQAYRAVVDYSLYDAIAMTLVCLMVDEFEQKVYTTNLKGFTAEDFDAIMDDIAKQYFPNGDVEEMLADMNYYWRQVVVDQPVYYVSYAVSGIAAVSLFTVAEKKLSDGMEVYRKLCEEPVLESGFLGNLQAAGLATPFDEQFYLDLLDLLKH